MIKSFTLGNFRSIRDIKTLFFEQTSHQNSLSTVIALYGANSSGKSNILHGMDMMSSLVSDSVRLNDGDKLPHHPFALDIAYREKATTFEIVFTLKDDTIRYGISYDKKCIQQEWLFITHLNDVEKPLFLRDEEGIAVYPEFAEGNGLEERTNNNRLFISLVAQLGGSLSKSIVYWFSEDLNAISGLKTDFYEGFTAAMFSEQMSCCAPALDFIRRMRLGFTEISTIEEDFDESKFDSLPIEIRKSIRKVYDNTKRIALRTRHKVHGARNDNNLFEDFDFEDFESQGTQKAVKLSGPLFDTLQRGGCLIVDELDASLHPLMTKQIIKLFLDEETNPYGAQLVFATHDTHLLSSKLLAPSQIWFTEKDDSDATDLYSLQNICNPDGTRPQIEQDDIEGEYIRGRYGAIPYLINK